MATESKTATDSRTTGVLIFHGGCFSGGKVTYDGPLAAALAEHFVVKRVCFSLSDPFLAEEQCFAAVKEMRASGVSAVVALGISSGGYHAWSIASRVDAVVGICPVLRPLERLSAIQDTTLRAKLTKRTMMFFKEEDPPNFFHCRPPCPSLVLTGDDDANVPEALWDGEGSHWDSLCATRLKTSGKGHNLCTDITRVPVFADLVTFLKSVKHNSWNLITYLESIRPITPPPSPSKKRRTGAPPRPKVYLATAFHEKAAIAKVAAAMESSLNAEITCKWWEVEQADATARSARETRAVGDMEIRGVATADLTVAFLMDDTYPYKGTLCELGIALGVQAERKMRGQAPNKVVVVHREGKSAKTTQVLCVPHIAAVSQTITLPEGAPWTDVIAFL